jgi:hypothetical protein
MKTISKSLSQSNVTRCVRRSLLTLALVVSSPVLSAQDTKEASTPTGFIRIANAIAPGTGNVNVVIDGNEVYPSGYKFGAVTGGIGLAPGGHSVTIRRAGVKEGTTKVNVEKNQTVTLIPFAERVPATDQEPAHFAIRILRLKQKETQGARSASFVSVSGMPELLAELRAPSGDWAKVPVKRLAIGETPILYPEGYAPVRVNGKEMEPIPVGDPGNYVVVLYDDAEGNIKTVSFRDFKFLSAD